ncbi:MAG: LacI family DNA-binding transcriptional regulator [Pseudomonadota bacterium]
MTKRHATIRDVARVSGVSVATVSRVLNGLDVVAEATRDKILQAVEQLDYVPHSAARAMATRQTTTIGVLLPDLHGEFFSEVIRGVDIAARAAHYHLLLSHSHGDPEEAMAAIRAMRSRVDGMIVMAPTIEPGGLMTLVRQSKLPVVLLNTDFPSSGVPSSTSVMVDNVAGARMLTEHLIAQGYNRIAHISGPPGNRESQGRQSGYEAAINAAFGVGSTMIVAGDFSEAAGFAAGRAIVAGALRPDAVFAANDIMAIGCIDALHQAGFAVPADIAVVGFDDIPAARFITPALTTVRVHIAELGRIAAKRLIAQVLGDGNAADGDAMPQPEIVVRVSCGALSTRQGATYQQKNPVEGRVEL